MGDQLVPRPIPTRDSTTLLIRDLTAFTGQ